MLVKFRRNAPYADPIIARSITDHPAANPLKIIGTADYPNGQQLAYPNFQIHKSFAYSAQRLHYRNHAFIQAKVSLALAF
jgi:hypothetical protein